MIDAYASQLSAVDHLVPILDALPDEHRGHLYAPRQIVAHAARRSIPIRAGTPPRSDDPLLVAGVYDLTVARRPKVFVEHGAGQRYVDAPDHPSYAGGAGRDRVGLFLCPRQDIADVNLARYPDAQAVAVGCPKLDRWAQIPRPTNVRPVVAVTFHWPCHLVPEAGWAFDHYADMLPALAAEWTVLGHAHPRARRQLEAHYARAGIECVWDPDELVRRADVLVADNTSLMYEWAALDRPVVALNAPSWRRDVEHGLRFWSHVPGVQCDEPRHLIETVRYALRPTMVATHTRYFTNAEIVGYVYGGLVDGHASERAATAVLEYAKVTR